MGTFLKISKQKANILRLAVQNSWDRCRFFFKKKIHFKNINPKIMFYEDKVEGLI